MILYHKLIFFTEENRFEEVKTLLKERYKLVAPSFADEERLLRQLVWEDESNIGRFRVNFSSGQKLMRHDIPGTGKIRYVQRTDLGSQPNIVFRYWGQRLEEITEQNDPMKEVYLGVYKLLKPVIVKDTHFADVNLDILLR